MLISPHPKETIKAIEKRRESKNMGEKIKKAINLKENYQDDSFYNSKHKSSTFYDTIRKHGGDEAIGNMQRLFNEDESDINAPSTEKIQIDPSDVELIENARKQQQEVLKKQQSLDKIEF